jgi:hypothetical protein
MMVYRAVDATRRRGLDLPAERVEQILALSRRRDIYEQVRAHQGELWVQ